MALWAVCFVHLVISTVPEHVVGVVLVCAPCQVLYPVVSFLVVQVADYWVIVWVRDKRLSDDPMDKSGVGFRISVVQADPAVPVVLDYRF